MLEPEELCERRELTIGTAFRGPGARDAIEMATRAVSDGRYEVTSSLERPDLGRLRERFVFRVGYRGHSVTLVLREGHVTGEFLDLARTEGRSAEQERRLDVLKREMAGRVMAQPAERVYDVTDR